MAYSRTGFTVKTNGQTLVVTATLNGSTSTLYSDAAVTSSVTLPQTITSDTTYYVADAGFGSQIVSVKQSDGTELWGRGIDCYRWTGIVEISPLPTAAQAGADLSPSAPGGYATGMSTLPRWAVQSVVVTTATGTMRLSGFTAPRTETVTKVRYLTGTTAAAATPTLVRVGLYSVDAAGAGTLVASTPNDTALSATISTSYEKSFSDPVTVTKGGLYAVGYLIVTAGQANTLVGTIAASGGSVTAENAALPRLCGSLAGQTDLPASYADASLSNTASVFYAVVSA